MRLRIIQIFSLVFFLLIFTGTYLLAQQVPAVDSIIQPIPSYAQRAAKWGPNDTIITQAIWFNNEMLSYKEHEMVWISKLKGRKLEKEKAEWTRLRNAVYVTYPYARVAGVTINEITAKMEGVTDKKRRKEIINEREKDLRKQFQQPLENLSVYQGKVLMKLINRQTGNNCYELIKEFKGGVNARMYQTVAFIFGSNLKQIYDVTKTDDRQIENIIKEIDGVWYNNPNRPLISRN